MNSSIQAYYQQKTLDQIELRWMHSMPTRITSVCTASTNTRLLLRCTFHSECPDMSLIEVIVMTVPGMSEWKKTTGLTGNFQLMPVRAASFFFPAAQKHMLVLQQNKPSSKTFFFFAPFSLEINQACFTKMSILWALTFFDDGLICHNNVVIYMLEEKKRLDSYM